MVEVTWDNNANTCKAMVAVIAVVFMKMLVLMLRRLITGKLLVAMVLGSGWAYTIAVHDFIVGKRMQLPGNHHSAGVNGIGNEHRQQQKYKTAK
jgi:hypothetical protein